MSHEVEPWQWRWHGTGVPDAKSGRGRTYYKSIEAFRPGENLYRVYDVGDIVNMSGDDEQVWSAQIVDLFQVRRDDDDLRRILRTDARNSASDGLYELMRCTLRWFYNSEDMNEDTLRRSSVPKQTLNEIYFSDHVEISGFNSVTVIDGMAWVFPSKLDRDRWLREPDPRYIPSLDIVRIVRTFVNSSSPDLTVRQMDPGELQYHMAHPCRDKNLFETGRQRMRGKFSAAGSIVRPSMKTLGSSSSKKRRRASRNLINVIDDDDYSDWDGAEAPNLEKEEPKLDDGRGGRSAHKEHQRRKERRNHAIVDDDDDDPPPSDAVQPHADSTREKDLEARQRAELQAAQSEVLDMVNELNQSIVDFEPGEPLVSANPLNGGEGIESVVTEKAISSNLTRAVIGKKPSAAQIAKAPVSAALHHRASSSDIPLQKRGSTSGTVHPKPSLSGLQKKKAVTSGHVIIIDEDNDSDEVPQRMQPSITPRRRRVREVGNPIQDIGKRRPPFMPTGRDKKTLEKNIALERKLASGDKGPSHTSNPVQAMNGKETVVEREAAQEIRGIQQNGPEGKPADKHLSRLLPVDVDLEGYSGSNEEAAKRRRMESLQNGRVIEEDFRQKKTKEKRGGLERRQKENATTRNAFSQGRPLAASTNNKSDLPAQKQGKTTISKSAGIESKESSGENEIDWWNETRKVLQKLKTEFQGMSPASQKLLSTHVDVVFDLAVRRVTDIGLFGKVDIQNEHLSSIAGGIIDDLHRTIANESAGNATGDTSVRERKGQEADVVRV